MNEAETRAELIDPKLKENGWDGKTNSDVKVHREYLISAGKIKPSGGRNKPVIADYVLSYKGRKLAVVEAKADELEVGEGVAQAKDYALKLQIDDTYAANGREIYHIDMDSAKEGLVENFQTPGELWNKVFPVQNEWQDNFNDVPTEDKGGTMGGRFYQDIAVERTLDAIAEKRNRILLTLATGTGKTFIAFQIAWKLFHTRWNLKYDGKRRPRILFLADRNILANQAYNAFSSFPEDALVRISPKEIRKKGSVPTNGSIFFTIFQTFMSGRDKDGNPVPYFGEYPTDYFDLIIIDECHRGGANDEGNWRGILEYFSPAVQIGLTATPKRKENADTYKYFGNPVYIYSLKEGINDGYLTPFKVRKITTSLDEYTYQPDDNVVEGEIEEGKTYTESDFNKIIEIKAREEKRVQIFMDLIDQNEKTLVFCATQDHAAAIRDLINQYKKSKEPNYCVRVTANDGELGEQYLREFQDNEKSIPTILTTSQKLSTGVDARNIRNIVLLRPVNNIVEFKQIIGRGTRLFDGKNFFIIYDFVNASERFKDPEWDGEPIEPIETNPSPSQDGPEDLSKVEDDGGENDREKPIKIKVKLGNGKDYEIKHSVTSTFIGPDGKPMTVQEFLNSLYGKLPELFKSEDELRKIWSNPVTRKVLLDKLAESGFGKDELTTLQKIIDAEKSDLFDVLEFIAYSEKPLTREERVASAQANIFAMLEPNQKEFLEFVLTKYIETGVEELDQEKLPGLLELKYHAVSDAAEKLGGVPKIRGLFIEFQRHLYSQRIA
jgi:type I restriction enzyme, R subunit